MNTAANSELHCTFLATITKNIIGVQSPFKIFNYDIIQKSPDSLTTIYSFICIQQDIQDNHCDYIPALQAVAFSVK